MQGYLVQERALADQVWGLGQGPEQQNRGLGRELEQQSRELGLVQAPDQGRELGHLAAGQVLVLGQHHLERVLEQGQWNGLLVQGQEQWLPQLGVELQGQLLGRMCFGWCCLQWGLGLGCL